MSPSPLWMRNFSPASTVWPWIVILSLSVPTSGQSSGLEADCLPWQKGIALQRSAPVIINAAITTAVDPEGFFESQFPPLCNKPNSLLSSGARITEDDKSKLFTQCLPGTKKAINRHHLCDYYRNTRQILGLTGPETQQNSPSSKSGSELWTFSPGWR